MAMFKSFHWESTQRNALIQNIKCAGVLVFSGFHKLYKHVTIYTMFQGNKKLLNYTNCPVIIHRLNYGLLEMAGI